MFTLISKFVDLMIDYTFPKDRQQDDTDLSYPNVQTVEQHISTFTNLEDSPFLIKPHVKSKRIQGTVTHICQDHGLINNDIYFSLSDVIGNHAIQIADSVETTVVQYSEDGVWHAEKVSILDKGWEDEEVKLKDIDLYELQSAAVLGKVTEFSMQRGVGKIDFDIEFFISDCDDGYVPAIGDWVSAHVKECGKETDGQEEDPWSAQGPLTAKRAMNVCPARSEEMEGRVTAVFRDYGFLNEDIYFRLSCCLNGYSPRRNDTVKAVLVESSQRKNNWRVTNIYPLSSSSNAYKLKQFREPAQRGTSAFLVPGQRPKFSQHKLILPVKLPHFAVPEHLESCVMEGRELTEVAPFLKKVLDAGTYSRRMSILLHLEEIQMQMDIRQFDLTRVCLNPVGEFLGLNVPGLAEGRPSVLIGDKIILFTPSDPNGPSYEGFVHEMTCTDVHLKFNPDFHCRYNGEDYNVEFTFSRGPLRKCHQAVSLAVQYLGLKVLFPKEVDLKSPQVQLSDIMPSEEAIYSSDRNTYTQNSKKKDDVHSHITGSKKTKDKGTPVTAYRKTCKGRLKFFNGQLNERQKAAVTNILIGQSRPVPYIIFGPPGTGKTITVVEAILQVLKRVPSSRIVACTPSNSAADLIAERLHFSGQVSQTDMVRFNAFQRSCDSLPESILKYCKFAEDIEAISHYRVIVATCTMAGSLYALGLSAGHLTHVFVDECGQATEPECLIPLGLVSGADGQAILQLLKRVPSSRTVACTLSNSAADLIIVLAGDPKQLGPIVASPFAKMYGLELSLLERFMSLPIYQRDEENFGIYGGFNPVLVKKLSELGDLTIDYMTRIRSGYKLPDAPETVKIQRESPEYNSVEVIPKIHVTMLVNNYRSHPSILELPSRLFYFSQLRPHADPALTHTLSNWDLLPAAGFPVVFHGIRGEDIREANSPSWFNPGETVLVMKYLQGALKEGVDPEDIGIITPYRKQVEKIRLMMDRLNMPDVKVGSVEEFQGQERQVIIISTVRSNEKLVGFDVRHSLGFLSSPKRFNVAITRAQALLVLVGNPHVLAQDINWRILIQLCSENGGYTGCDLPDFSVYPSETNEFSECSAHE